MVWASTAHFSKPVTALTGRNRAFGHFWDAPYRPLFLASFVCALVTVAWWPLAVGQGASPPAFEPVVLWHIHELFFGFAAAAVGGYLLTALPNWTAKPPVSGTPLKLLVLFWLIARVATAMAGYLPLSLLLVLNSGYFLGLSGILLHQILTAGAFNKIGLGFAILALGGAQSLFLTAALTGDSWISLSVAHAALVGFVLLMATIGARAVPAFTNNWLNLVGRGNLKIEQAAYSRLFAQSLLVLSVIGMLVGEQMRHILH